VRQWAEWQALMMTPITPHWSEAMWELLGKPGCIVHAPWPKPSVAEDAQITAAGEYLFDVAHALAAALVNRAKKKPAKGKEAAPLDKPNQVNLYVAQSWPRWKEIVLDMLRAHFNAETSEVNPAVMPLLNKNEELLSFNKGKQVSTFAAMVIKEATTKGAAAFALSMPFDEHAILKDNLPYLCANLAVSAVHLYTDAVVGPEAEVQTTAVPGKPQPHFYFSESLEPAPAAPAAANGSAAAAPSRPTSFEYCEAHGLAQVLNAAVNTLGKEQPADPYAWLAANITELAKKQKK